MNRRTCLSLLASTSLVTAAGCLTTSTGDNSVPSESPTRSPTKTPDALNVSTPAPGECEATAPPKPETYEGLPDPKSYPERPDSLEKTAVRTFLESYEVAYTFNDKLAWHVDNGDCLKYLEIYGTGVELTERGEGFVAEVSVRGSSTGAACPGEQYTGTDTATAVMHADFPTMTARYALTDRFLVREDVVMECWS